MVDVNFDFKIPFNEVADEPVAATPCPRVGVVVAFVVHSPPFFGVGNNFVFLAAVEVFDDDGKGCG